MNFKKLFSAGLMLPLIFCAWGCARFGGSETALPTESTAPLTVTVTFPEGKTLTEIFQLLEENGVCSFNELMETAKTYDFSAYPLIAAIPEDKKTAYRLEGYLFPDTYEFYTDSDPVSVIKKFLDNAETRLTAAMRMRAEKRGYSVNEILTIASIIQQEGSKSSEVKKIAGVIDNRLEDGMRLQMDSTTQYVKQYVQPYWEGDTKRYDALYNTYTRKGLPEGPICCPGIETIEAALYPADVSYYYFCNDAKANYYYARTYKEHLRNVKAAGLG